MPEVGEVWRNSLGGQEAVITDASSDAVRVMSRLGRLVVLPMRTFSTTWVCIRALDEVPHICHQCDRVAVGFYLVGGATRWVCRQHRPQGGVTRFPGDEDAGPEHVQKCPRCLGNRVHSKALVTKGDVTAPHFQCRDCDTEWFQLQTVNLSTTEVMSMIERFVEEVNPEMNSRIYCCPQTYRGLDRNGPKVDGAFTTYLNGLHVMQTDILGSDTTSIVSFSKRDKPFEPPEINLNSTRTEVVKASDFWSQLEDDE